MPRHNSLRFRNLQLRRVIETQEATHTVQDPTVTKGHRACSCSQLHQLQGFWDACVLLSTAPSHPFQLQTRWHTGQTGRDLQVVLSVITTWPCRQMHLAGHRLWAQALLQDIQQKCTMRGGLGSSCREHVDSARLEGWLLQCGCPVYNMNTINTFCITWYIPHTQVFAHVCTHPQKHTHIHTCIGIYLWLVRQGEIISGFSGVHDFWTAKKIS